MSISLSFSHDSASNLDAVSLLSAALDPKGWIYIFGKKHGAAPKVSYFEPGQYENAAQHCVLLSKQGWDAYYCTGTLKDRTSRESSNIFSVKVLKLDLDIAKNDSSKYPSKKDAVEKLLGFCDATSFPFPVLIDSGNGVHAYWILSTPLMPELARKYSAMLKAIVAGFGLKTDPSVTADISRLLRLPGTMNFKNTDNPKPVVLRSEIVEHDTVTILTKLDGLHAKVADRKRETDLITSLLPDSPRPAHLGATTDNEAIPRPVHRLPKRFSILLDRSRTGTGCNQIRDIYENQHSTGYDRWRSGLSIAYFCSDGAEAIHAISQNHPQYMREDTVSKAESIAAPHKCATFAAQQPGLCTGCPHQGRIHTPIVLAVDDNAANDAANSLDDALALIREAQIRTKAGDVGAPFESTVIDALRTVQTRDPAEYQRLRAAFKDANRDVSVTALDAAMRSDTKSRERTLADMLVELARQHCQFFHNADDEAHATFIRDGHRECWHLYSKGFHDWLSFQFYCEHGSAPADTSMVTALSTLAGQAQFEGEEKPVAMRVAKQGGSYYIDLCDTEWRAVRVNEAGWQVIQASPVMFVRTASMRPLPMPIEGGSIEALWQFANIEPDDRLLVLTWLVESFRPDTPYPVLELVAEQGAAKSFTQSIIRELTDPNKANLRAKPKSIDDLFVTAKMSHITSLENLSYLAADFQDALCSLATGAGYGGRTLYTNAEETVFEIKRPIMMNGISVVATAQDLIDRTLLISCPIVSVRQTEADLNAKFEKAKSHLFGALLTLFAGALVKLPLVVIHPNALPRMADFAYLGEAVFRAMGQPDGEFLSKYGAKRKHGVLQTIDSSPVASALRGWLDENPDGYIGNVKGLENILMRHRPIGEPWPKSTKALGDALRRISPAMRMLGFDIKHLGHRRDGHHLQIEATDIATQ